MDMRRRENGLGVWKIKVGSIEHKIVAHSGAEAEAWLINTTGLAPHEYGDVVEVSDLDSLTVRDTSESRGVDHKGRHIYNKITAREAIRRQTIIPGELGM